MTTLAPLPALNMDTTKLVTRAKAADGSALYPEYLHFYDPLEKVEDLGSFEHNDPGHRADPKLTNLLKTAERVIDLSPHVGTEIEGVQLSQLSSAGLDELALMAAKRGAIVLRGQDFGDIGLERQKAIARHFGPLPIHGWAPHPASGSEEHMVIYDHKEGEPQRPRHSRKKRRLILSTFYRPESQKELGWKVACTVAYGSVSRSTNTRLFLHMHARESRDSWRRYPHQLKRASLQISFSKVQKKTRRLDRDPLQQ